MALAVKEPTYRTVSFEKERPMKLSGWLGTRRRMQVVLTALLLATGLLLSTVAVEQASAAGTQAPAGRVQDSYGD
jgi:hypothetical protein